MVTSFMGGKRWKMVNDPEDNLKLSNDFLVKPESCMKYEYVFKYQIHFKGQHFKAPV